MPLRSFALRLLGFLIAAALATSLSAGETRDLKFSYRSAVDGTEQPYRLYVPANYKTGEAGPLIIAMHGTGGDENTILDVYSGKPVQQAAEKHGVLVVCPRGGSGGPTEYRGVGEVDVLAVLADVRRRYPIDPTRIYLTGHSMGGTGSAYLALHHPDMFAAAAPLAAAYSFPWLARNAAQVPMLWVGGADDATFYLRGVMVGIEAMLKFGADVKLELLPGQGHVGPMRELDHVFAWLLKQRRDPHPTSYVFDVDTPLHGRAWWTDIRKIAVPGKMASVEAQAVSRSHAALRLTNVAEIAFAPDPVVFDLSAPTALSINGSPVWSGSCSAGSELKCLLVDGKWRVSPREAVRPEGYRCHPVAEAPEELTMRGTEKRLADWIADAMRSATGADIALYSPVYYRGLPIAKGTVDVIDIIQCSRPFDQCLVTIDLTGHELIQILEDNLAAVDGYRAMGVDLPGAGRLVQVSGMRYSFDRRQPPGKRIVESDLEPARRYSVVVEAQVVERSTILLAGRFKKLDYHMTDIPLSLALFGYAARSPKLIAPAGGRVREVNSTAGGE